MLKFLKGLLAILGIAGIVAAAVLLGFRLWPDVNTLMGAANQGRSNNLYANPMNLIMLIGGIAAAGGLLLGLGLGMPSRTAGGIRKDALQEADARREADIRDRARLVDRKPADRDTHVEAPVVEERVVRDRPRVEEERVVDARSGDRERTVIDADELPRDER